MHDPEKIKENIAAAAVSGAGATVGSAGGATVGVLELAARGAAVTGLSAGVVIGAGAVAGAGLAYGIFRLFRGHRKKRTLNEPTTAGPQSDIRR
jgi:hypothetical protein